MFLVRHQYVGDQWTFTWQERNSDFNCFAMPILRVSSCVDVLTQHFLQLVQEPVLCAHAKVGDRKKT